MPSPLFQVMYHGNAPWAMAPADLASIAAVSQRRNQADGITGMLLYGWQQFVQIIEGPSDSLLGVLGRIARDERCSIIYFDAAGEINERSFPDWAMATINVEHIGGEARFRFAEMIMDLSLRQDPRDRVARFREHLDVLRAYLDVSRAG